METENSSGLMENFSNPLSKMTEARICAEKNINSIAGNDSNKAGKIITSILYANLPQIESYVFHNGEKPLNNPLGLFVQAALIRCKKIAYVASAIDGTDVEGLHTIEDDETEAKELNYPDSEYILTPDVQASLKKILERIKSKYGKGCDCDLYEVITSLKEKSGSDSFDFSIFDLIGNYYQDDPAYNDEFYKDQAVLWSAMYPELNDSFNGSGLVANGNDVFGFVDNLFKGIDGIIDDIKEAGSDVGAGSIEKYVKENLPLIIGIILLIGLVIYFSIYAANKSK